MGAEATSEPEVMISDPNITCDITTSMRKVKKKIKKEICGMCMFSISEWVSRKGFIQIFYVFGELIVFLMVGIFGED